MASTAWLQARLTATQAQIEAYEDAIAALGASGAAVLSYSIDTGQTRQQVTRANLSDLQETLDRLYCRYEALYNRLNGGASIIMRPPR